VVASAAHLKGYPALAVLTQTRVMNLHSGEVKRLATSVFTVYVAQSTSNNIGLQLALTFDSLIAAWSVGSVPGDCDLTLRISMDPGSY